MTACSTSRARRRPRRRWTPPPSSPPPWPRAWRTPVVPPTRRRCRRAPTCCGARGTPGRMPTPSRRRTTSTRRGARTSRSSPRTSRPRRRPPPRIGSSSSTTTTRRSRNRTRTTTRRSRSRTPTARRASPRTSPRRCPRRRRQAAGTTSTRPSRTRTPPPTAARSPACPRTCRPTPPTRSRPTRKRRRAPPPPRSRRSSTRLRPRRRAGPGARSRRSPGRSRPRGRRSRSSVAASRAPSRARRAGKGKVTAADLLADGYAAQPVEEAPAAPAAVKYTAAELRASGSAHPLAASVQGLPVEAQADEVSFSEDLAAPPPIKYTKLAKTNTDVMEEYDSADFLNNKLLAHNALAVDIRRHGLVAKSKSLDAIMADRALVKMGLKRVWGWTDEDIAKYFDFGTNRAKQSKVTFIRDEADLKKFVVHAGASMTYGDPPQPFDTGPMVSKASGPGFAIFVMDGAGNIYAGQHRVGLFHHSSFLAGRDVTAAGEQKVSAGKLEVKTSKSGHYTPDAEQTWQAVKEMAALGVSFAGAEVRVWGQNKTDVYGGEEFLRRGAQAKIVRTEGRF